MGKLIDRVLSCLRLNTDVSITASAALLVFLACVMRVMFHQQVGEIRVDFLSPDANNRIIPCDTNIFNADLLASLGPGC